MWECSSRFQRRSGRGWPTPATTGVDCSMRHGVSGGGWTIESAEGGPPVGLRLKLLRAWDAVSVWALLLGPYFTKSVTGILRAAVRG